MQPMWKILQVQEFFGETYFYLPQITLKSGVDFERKKKQGAHLQLDILCCIVTKKIQVLLIMTIKVFNKTPQFLTTPPQVQKLLGQPHLANA